MKNIIYVFLVLVFIAGCGSPKSKSESHRDYLKEGVALLKKHDFKGALISFHKAIEQNPDDVEPHLILGKIYMDGEQYAEAIKHFEAVGELQPDNGKIFLTLAKCYEQTNNLEKAVNNAKRSALIFKAKNETENYQRALAVVGILMKASTQTVEVDVSKNKSADNNASK